MPAYAIKVSPTESSREFEVLLRGPGIDPQGRRFIFATTHRCALFAQAVNFTYEQGFRDALRKSIGEEVRLPPRQGARTRRANPAPALQELSERALRTRVNAVESELEIGFSFVAVAQGSVAAQVKRKALGKARTARDVAISAFHVLRTDLPEPVMNSIVERLRELERAISDYTKPLPK